MYFTHRLDYLLTGTLRTSFIEMAGSVTEKHVDGEGKDVFGMLSIVPIYSVSSYFSFTYVIRTRDMKENDRYKRRNCSPIYILTPNNPYLSYQ